MSGDFLIEIGTEELPPKSLDLMAERFARGLFERLCDAQLAPSEPELFYTPRRMAVRFQSLALRQSDSEQHRLGPAVAAAFDGEGQPTRAAEGFARSVGVSVAELDREVTDKGERLAYRCLVAGRSAEEIIPEVVAQSLKALPIPKPMRWGDLEEAFVRPVHWIVMLLADKVVPGQLYGQAFGNTSRGHRFHHPEPVVIGQARSYVELMRGAFVVVDACERRATIREQATAVALEAGGTAMAPEALVHEVANLVEWPVALTGSFDEAFLSVPKEALISSMQGHQRFFPIENDSGELLARFVSFANIQSHDPTAVVRGLERVIRPRLADARFFWLKDRKTPLIERQAALEKMIYQKRLGSLADKSARVVRLAGLIAEQLGEDGETVQRAARLLKCDLVTDMVYEFPELQGIMGRYYAQAEDEPEAVAWAIEEHYRPRFAGDELPERPLSRILGIADRLDTLAGIFAVGLKPTGNKDPFALRRAALGLIRLLIEDGPDLDLAVWIEQALKGIADHVELAPAVNEEVLDFVMDRLRAYYVDLGIGSDEFEAVWARRPTHLKDFHARVRACQVFQVLDSAQALAAANKRIGNLLRKAAEADEGVSEKVAPKLFQDEAEGALYAALEKASEDTAPLLLARDYQATLARLAELRSPVDDFFDQVMVMAEDPGLKANRLALLTALKRSFDAVADISQLDVSEG
jgi:glycyl-tRNA synthetase beta chain